MDPNFPAPEVLHYVESSLFGGTREVHVQGGVLHCTAGQGSEGGPSSQPVALTPNAWKHLFEVLSEMDAWHWSGYYGNLTAVDGVNWALDVAWCGQSIEAAGYHSWPGREREFEHLLTLLRRLARGEHEGWVAGRPQLV